MINIIFLFQPYMQTFFWQATPFRLTDKHLHPPTRHAFKLIPIFGQQDQLFFTSYRLNNNIK